MVPDEPLDSSPDTFDPDGAGRSIVSIVRVPVRMGADMSTPPAGLVQRQYCKQATASQMPRSSSARRQPPSVELGLRAGYAGISSWTLCRR